MDGQGRVSRCKPILRAYGRHRALDRIDFREPVKLGDIVELVATVTSVGRSSMTVRVSLLHETVPGSEPKPATTGEFVMVAVDAAGHAVSVGRAHPATAAHRGVDVSR
jgi:acyl-CoA hydrolase